MIIDNHSEDPTVENDPALWVTYWTELMKDIAADPTSRKRVMIDILNEPDHAGFKWDAVWLNPVLHGCIALFLDC